MAQSLRVKSLKKNVDLQSKKEIRTAAPLFVPATRDGILASRLRSEEEKLSGMVGWRLKIVERGGEDAEGHLNKVQHI